MFFSIRSGAKDAAINYLTNVISFYPTPQGLPRLHLMSFLNGAVPSAIFFYIDLRSKFTIEKFVPNNPA